MTHDDLLEEITAYERRTCNSAQDNSTCVSLHPLAKALRAVVELHKPEHSHSGYRCTVCFIDTTYPCETIETIEKELG